LKRLRVPDLKLKKQRGEKISVLTAYDATTARLLDSAGVDILLVGDSLGMVVLGYDSTIPVTLEDMVHHTAAVSRGATRALVIADMPFLTYQVSVEDALINAGRLVQEGGAAGVKVEGGQPVLETVHRLTSIGIPVMGHLGLLPQSEHQLGGFRKQATEADGAKRLLSDAVALEQAGAFSIVLESIPPDVAQRVSKRISIPTIGIGAGPHCDGQVLVSHDLFGMSGWGAPPFAKQYAQLGDEMVKAAQAYIADVQAGRFPTLEPERRKTK
jgi:3-methyl-2-oxobutanoate hydroxymethyltransferase